MDLLEVLTSWEMIYLIIALPGIMLMLNFVIGNCFISDALAANQHAEGSTHTASRTVGRACVALIVVSFAWQYYVYMFASRQDISQRSDYRSCNPVYAVWDAVDTLPFLHRLRPIYLLDCTVDELVYQASLACFVVLYASCVLSAPQTPAQLAASSASDATQPISKKKLVSYCSKCAAHVVGRDHHCYLVGNCVGAANHRMFMWCVASGVVNLLFLLYRCGGWALRSHSPVTFIGLLLVCCFSSLLCALLMFHVLLVRRGISTWEFLRTKRKERTGWLRSLASLARGQ